MGSHAPEYRRFLTRLKQARLDAALTQVEVARRLGKPQSYVAKCEGGERRVDAVELLAFARIYRKSPASWARGEDSGQGATPGTRA